MNLLVCAVVGAVSGIGVVLVLAGLRGRAALGVASHAGRSMIGARVDRLAVRIGLGLVAFVITFAVTGWPVAAVSAGGVGMWLPSMTWRSRSHREELDVIDGIATWTEQLRDTISAANGLEHAIVASARLAPRALAPAAARLASRAEFNRVDEGLREFARTLETPLADFVVAALITAEHHQAREVGTLLGQLSACARDEAAMRRRIWVGRARSRSSVRIIALVVVVFTAGLLTFDDAYLAPYSTATGQLVLGAVIGLFGVAFLAMERMGRLDVPERFIAHRGVIRP